MATATAKVPVNELGHVASWSQLAGYPDDASEYTGPLIWPNSVRTFDVMRVNSTVHSVLTAVTNPIRRPNVFALDPQGARPEIVAQLAEDLDLAIVGQDRVPPPRRRGRFSWLEHVRLALLMLVYGHMGFEMLCDPDALAATGMARLRKLAPRFPQSIEQIKVAADGGLESVLQFQIGKEPPKPIPVSSLVWYANEREGAAWQGRSILRPCYGDWLLLDRLLRVRGILMERQGMGVPVGEAPPAGPGMPAASQDVINMMAELAQQARAGDQSGVGIPNGARIRLVGVEGTLPDINGAIADHKAALADSVMASWLRLGTNKASGNRALGQTFVDQFTQSEDMVAGAIADIATQHVVEDLVDLNWGESEPAPAIVARAIDAETDIDPADLVQLIQVGAITPDESIEKFLRSRFRLPKRIGPRPAPVASSPPPLAAARKRQPGETYADKLTSHYTPRVRTALEASTDPAAIVAALED